MGREGPCGEHVHQSELFAILQYGVKMVIKPIIFNHVARQPVLTWQAVCTLIVVVRRLICYHPSIKRIYDHPVLSYGTF